MFCKKCGANIPDGTTVCPSCGQEIAAAPKADQNQQASNKSNVNGFYKSKDGKLLAGVCAGLGKKFDIKPWLVRAIFIVVGFIPILDFVSLILYILGAIAWKYDE